MNPIIEKLIAEKYDTIACERRTIELLERFGQVKLPDLVYIAVNEYSWKKGEINVYASPLDPKEAVSLSTALMRVLGIKKVDKTFDASTGKMTLKGRDGNKNLTISTLPARCRVRAESYEVEVAEVPAVKAHTETRQRYVIENPEECGASGSMDAEPEED